jgi:hypothetical protein
MLNFLEPFLIPLLIASGVVFVIALIGNLFTFQGRFSNALFTAFIAAIAWLAAAWFTQGEAVFDKPGTFEVLGAAFAAVFVADLIGNGLNFSNRFGSAVATAIVFALLHVGLLVGLYYLIPPLQTA